MIYAFRVAPLCVLNQCQPLVLPLDFDSSRLCGRPPLKALVRLARAAVSKEQVGYTFGSYILRFRLNPERRLNPRFVASFINSELGQTQILYLQTGAREAVRGGGNNINSNQLKQLQLILPKDNARQEEIVGKTMKLFEEANTIKRRLDGKIHAHSEGFETILRQSVNN